MTTLARTGTSSASIPTDILVHHDHDELSVDATIVRQLAERTLATHAHPDGHFSEISIVLSHRDAVHELNRAFLDHDYPTDVLSFLIVDTPPFEGEVYVDLDTANERCIEFGSSFELEAYRYVVHGLLHLTGMNDGTTEERNQMHVAENAILQTVTSA